MRAEDVLSTILKTETLPTLPVVASKILAVTDREDTEPIDLAKIIARDASLASRILRVVNSPFYGLISPVGTISKAVSVLGINPVRNLVLSFSLINTEKKEGDRFDYEHFWERSLASAVTVRWLLEELGGYDPSEGFIAGLLQEIGEMLLARTYPDQYDRVLEEKPASPGACPILERKILGIDHCEAGAALAKHWRFPAFLQNSIRHHHAPDEYAGCEDDLRQLIRVSHLAGIVSDMFHSPDPAFLKGEFIRLSRQYFGVGENLFQTLAAGVHDEVGEAADYFGLRVKMDRSIEEILQEANRRLGQINLAYEQRTRELAKVKTDLACKNDILQRKNKSLQQLADLDGLTGVYNHRYFQRFLHNEMSRASRKGHTISLFLVDVDNFKVLNDTSGHQVGDSILKELCRIFRSLTREYDLVARYGGEEFAIVLPETSYEVACAVADRIRKTVAEHAFLHLGQTYQITISIGVASEYLSGEVPSPTGLINQADRALLEAKTKGKNRVVGNSRN